MTSKERFDLTDNHQQPDRLVVDFGSTAVTGIHVQSVESFISQFVDAGFDIINPVQVSAKGMDPAHLKKTYGKDLVFWGGGIDTQKTCCK